MKDLWLFVFDSCNITAVESGRLGHVVSVVEDIKSPLIICAVNTFAVYLVTYKTPDIIKIFKVVPLRRV